MLLLLHYSSGSGGTSTSDCPVYHEIVVSGKERESKRLGSIWDVKMKGWNGEEGAISPEGGE